MLSAKDFVAELKKESRSKGGTDTFSIGYIENKLAEMERTKQQMDRPCDAEIHSWWKLDPNQTDSYWMRCGKIGLHTVHEHSDTGVTWTDEEFKDVRA